MSTLVFSMVEFKQPAYLPGIFFFLPLVFNTASLYTVRLSQSLEKRYLESEWVTKA